MAGKVWSKPESRSRSKSASFSRDEKMDEATSQAERIRASRGNYEAEVTCTGEAGLHQCALMCPKNPGHDKFIPTNDFNIDHLPSGYHDSLLVDYVRATSDLTCRLAMSHISEDRPDTWPDSEKAFPFSIFKGENSTMVGTGWVWRVQRNVVCPCDECRGSDTNKPKKMSGQVWISTACHLVYDSEEVRHTKCQFFYDSHETDINKVLTLTGLKLWNRDIKRDVCTMTYITHDVELLDRFVKMWDCWLNLRHEVINKYFSNNSTALSVPGAGCDTNVNHDLCIIVSHPHGCTKVISVGTWTHRQVVNKYNSGEYVIYSYNTPTCPGSSGAPVITLCKDKFYMFYQFPPHSEGGPGNDNNSGTGQENL